METSAAHIFDMKINTKKHRENLHTTCFMGVEYIILYSEINVELKMPIIKTKTRVFASLVYLIPNDCPVVSILPTAYVHVALTRL